MQQGQKQNLKSDKAYYINITVIGWLDVLDQKFTSKKILFQIQNEPESRREWMLKIFEDEAEQSKKHKTYKFWQVGNHAIEVFTEKFIWDKINYIHENLVRAGLVKEQWDWIYSSASNYQDEESVLEVLKIPQRLITYN